MKHIRVLTSQIVIIFLLAAGASYSQEKENANNTIYAELLGNGLFSSLNYERTISNDFCMRLGLGFAFSNSESNSGGHHTTAFIPLAMLNYLIEIYGNNYFELGAGAILASSEFTISDTFERASFTAVPTFAFGYRNSPKEGGIFFSAAFDLFTYPPDIMPWGGLGIGYKF